MSKCDLTLSPAIVRAGGNTETNDKDPRPQIDLTGRGSDSLTGRLILLCSWCRKHVGTKACEPELDGKTSHTICEACSAQVDIGSMIESAVVAMCEASAMHAQGQNFQAGMRMEIWGIAADKLAQGISDAEKALRRLEKERYEV
jgi:hypothetical protein